MESGISNDGKYHTKYKSEIIYVATSKTRRQWYGREQQSNVIIAPHEWSAQWTTFYRLQFEWDLHFKENQTKLV